MIQDNIYEPIDISNKDVDLKSSHRLNHELEDIDEISSDIGLAIDERTLMNHSLKWLNYYLSHQ